MVTADTVEALVVRRGTHPEGVDAIAFVRSPIVL